MHVAIIGCGTLGALHAQMAATCGLTIAVCADYIKKQATTLANRYNAEALTDGIKAIRRADVDIVVIATPTTSHLEHVIAAAEAGKAIFCEKPFCRTTAECRDAIAAAKKNNVSLFVGHVVRYFQDFEAVRAQVAAGKVGKPGTVRTYRGGIMPKGWFRDYEMSGGATLDMIIHDFDWIRYTFGEVEAVFSQSLRRDKPVPMDYSQTTLRLKSGVIATATGSWAHPDGFRTSVEVCGDGGMVLYDSNETPMTSHKRAPKGSAANVIVPASPVLKSPYRLEWEDFLAWIREGRAPKVTMEDGMEAVRIAEAALKSAATNKRITL